MWPFRKKSAQETASAIMDEAIDLAAERWRVFTRSVVMKSDVGLRDRIGIFARSFEPSLKSKYPPLASASDSVLLLIIAKGVEESRTFSRQDIEDALGITLPR
jgi:hypothetical protein